ncbi:MAG: NADH-quinone oxidoreductase subunit A [Desulfobacterales bacterium]|nr:NADH-quinone oxidoreductase subunit A [Desulfobacterales bacterium]
MGDQELLDFIYIMLFMVCGFLAAFVPFLISDWVRPRLTNYRKTLETYECGIPPFGEALDFRFGVAYYLYALIFLAFDVDILYLFPVATAFDQVGAVRGVVEVAIFLGILSLAIVYAWVKGVFRWENKTRH